MFRSKAVSGDRMPVDHKAVVAVSRPVLVLDVGPPEPDIIKDDVARVDLHHHVRRDRRPETRLGVDARAAHSRKDVGQQGRVGSVAIGGRGANSEKSL